MISNQKNRTRNLTSKIITRKFMKFSDLSLTGFGYLQEFVRFNGDILARIYCLPAHENNANHNEAIILNCLVNDFLLKAKLGNCGSHLENGSAILLKFTANYLETTSFQTCVTKDDPDHIINIAAKLVAIDKVYIDGACFLEPSEIDLKIVNL